MGRVGVGVGLGSYLSLLIIQYCGTGGSESAWQPDKRHNPVWVHQARGRAEVFSR